MKVKCLNNDYIHRRFVLTMSPIRVCFLVQINFYIKDNMGSNEKYPMTEIITKHIIANRLKYEKIKF